MEIKNKEEELTVKNISALIETFGLAGMKAADGKPTLEEVTQFQHSKNILIEFGVQPCAITQEDIDKAWDEFIKLED